MNLFNGFYHHLPTGIRRQLSVILSGFSGNFGKGIFDGLGEVNAFLNIHGLSRKASLNYLYYNILLLRCHLVVAGQAEAAGEDVGADVGGLPRAVTKGFMR